MTEAELASLKVRAYDLIAVIEALQKQLREVNDQIATAAIPQEPLLEA